MIGINEINKLMSFYGKDLIEYESIHNGVGSEVYKVITTSGIFILKNPTGDQINNLEAEPDICKYLNDHDFKVSTFEKSVEGKYVVCFEQEIFSLQRYFEGRIYPFNETPDWLMVESAKKLGSIHELMKNYHQLDIGIGTSFFEYKRSQNTLHSYLNTLEIAKQKNDVEIIEDLEFRIDLIKRYNFDDICLEDFTCLNTHGDYNVSQIICSDNKIEAIIDWTSACVHPIVWEIMRSFVYAEPTCKDGKIDIDKLIKYIKAYLTNGALTKKDIELMPKLFFYQITVCDYYGLFYNDVILNKQIMLHHAIFSTKLMRWFDDHIDSLVHNLMEEFCNLD
ncbi:MAG: phosphotransferase [Clostridiales bacterium]|nr:phosphotransferase [Clostridiales bacterium]